MVYVFKTKKRTREAAKHFSLPPPVKKTKMLAATPEQRLVDGEPGAYFFWQHVSLATTSCSHTTPMKMI